MSESIFVRVQRVVTSSVSAAVETAERASGVGLMAEAVRDAEDALDKLRVEQARVEERRRQHAIRETRARADLDKLDEQARYALARKRPDLAEAAVTRQVEVEAEIAALLDNGRALAGEEARLAEAVADLTQRHARLRAELRAYRQTQQADTGLTEAATPLDVRMARKVSRAEDAFHRAMDTVGTTPAPARSADAEAKLQEIEALKREVLIAERMAALRAATGEAPAADPRPRKRDSG
jgi:phage shock protein A